jgi:hypothetical protein
MHEISPLIFRRIDPVREPAPRIITRNAAADSNRTFLGSDELCTKTGSDPLFVQSRSDVKIETENRDSSPFYNTLQNYNSMRAGEETAVAFTKLHKFGGGGWGRVYSRAPRKTVPLTEFRLLAQTRIEQGDSHAGQAIHPKATRLPAASA